MEDTSKFKIESSYDPTIRLLGNDERKWCVSMSKDTCPCSLQYYSQQLVFRIIKLTGKRTCGAYTNG